MIKYTTNPDGLTLEELREVAIRIRDKHQFKKPIKIRSCDRIPAHFPLTTRIMMKNLPSTKFAFYTYLHGFYYIFRNGMTLSQLRHLLEDNDIEELNFSSEQKYKKQKGIPCKIAVDDRQVLTLRGT